MLKRFWLSYDLGIDGDYDGLYAWLDGEGAVECGDSMCSFEFDPGKIEPSKAVLSAIKTRVTFRKKDRIYLIWRRDNGSVTGRFILGLRRRTAWAGYAVQSSEDSEDEAD